MPVPGWKSHENPLLSATWPLIQTNIYESLIARISFLVSLPPKTKHDTVRVALSELPADTKWKKNSMVRLASLAEFVQKALKQQKQSTQSLNLTQDKQLKDSNRSNSLEKDTGAASVVVDSFTNNRLCCPKHFTLHSGALE